MSVKFIINIDGDPSQVASFMCDMDAAVELAFQQYPDIAVSTESTGSPSQPSGGGKP